MFSKEGHADSFGDMKEPITVDFRKKNGTSSYRLFEQNSHYLLDDSRIYTGWEFNQSNKFRHIEY